MRLTRGAVQILQIAGTYDNLYFVLTRNYGLVARRVSLSVADEDLQRYFISLLSSCNVRFFSRSDIWVSPLMDCVPLYCWKSNVARAANGILITTPLSSCSIYNG